MHTGAWEEVETEYLDRITRGEWAGNVSAQYGFMMGLGLLYVMRGDTAAAENLYRQAITVPTDPRTQIYPLLVLAVLCAQDGRIGEAAGFSDRARALSLEMIDHAAEGDLQRATGAIAAAKGDLEGAERAFLRALECNQEYRAPRARILHDWGRALLKNDRIDDARARFNEAIVTLREIHYAERYIETIERERDAARA